MNKLKTKYNEGGSKSTKNNNKIIKNTEYMLQKIFGGNGTFQTRCGV